MKLLPLLLAMITITCANAQFAVTDRTVNDSLIQQDDQVKILYFTASWCGPCQAMKPIIKTLDEDENLNLAVFIMDIDINQTDDYLQINSIPTLFYFKNGVKIGSSVGLKRAAVIKRMVRKYEALDPTDATFIFVTKPSAYEIVEGNDKELSRSNLILLWNRPKELQKASRLILEEYNHPQDLRCGLQLILRDLEIRSTNSSLFLKARLLARLNRNDEAIATAQQIIDCNDVSRRLKKKVLKFKADLD